jgi:hypothetical protein
MKKRLLIGAALMASVSSLVFAEEHATTALEHINMAIVHGKAGHGPVLVEHANSALNHANKAVEAAQGESKTHMKAAVQSLKSAIEHGKMTGPEHVTAATKAAEEAAEHIKAGNK